VDYNPERCKDYYEHGYCRFGDTCIYIHDRGDYKSGYQLDQEWEEKQRRGGNDESSDYEIKSEEEGPQTYCLVCQGGFIEPVKAPCGHIFCEKCALESFKQDPNCLVCRRPTNGSFKDACKEVEAIMKSLEEVPAEDDEIAREMREREEQVNTKKYTAQSGWYIP
jgi:RING finger protein 113A